MKIFTFFLNRKSWLILVSLFMAGFMYGATFTATTSGNFSSSATWIGGIAPPSINALDVIIIQPGVTVHLDQDLTLSGVLATLEVNGMLTTANNASLSIVMGTVSGTGTMALTTLDLHAGADLEFEGSLTADVMNVYSSILTTADVVVSQTLNLISGNLSVISEGSLSLDEGATIVVSDGLITVEAGGSIDLSGSYNVIYINNSAVAGIELTGPGLNNVEVNVNPGSSVTLTSDLTVGGTLVLENGILVLATNDLTVNGNVVATGTGTIASTTASNITLNTSDSSTGIIHFEDGFSTTQNLIVNAGVDHEVSFGGDLTIDGTLLLTSGIMTLVQTTLTINGDIAGSGMLSAQGATDLVINIASGLTSELQFAADGQTLQNLSISAGANNSISLGSDLTVEGTLSLLSGSDLNLGDNSLTLGSASTLTGTGSFMVNPSSELIINSTSGISSLGMNGTIGNLTINTVATNNVSLGSDANITGILDLQSGIMDLNGFDLQILGDLDASGTGTISSSAASDIILNTTSGLSGTLSFTSGASTVNNLMVNLPTNTQASIEGNLTIEGALELTNGILSFYDASLTIQGDIIGSAGLLSGNAASDLFINTENGLTSELQFAANGQTLQDLTISVGAGHSVGLGSDLTIEGILSLTGESNFQLNSNDLTLGSNSTLTGTGAIMGDANADLTVHSTGGIQILNLLGTIGDFTMNITSNSGVVLGSNMTIAGNMDLQSGELVLNGHLLSIQGNIAAGAGSISTDASSDISISTAGSLIGALNFSPDANTVGNLLINVAGEGSATLGTDLQITGSLQFIDGYLDIGTNTLSFEATATVTGAGIDSYIITEAGGFVEMNLEAGTGISANFPVGTQPYFAPVTLSLNPGSSSGQFQVGVVTNVLSDGTFGTDMSQADPLVDATWHVNSDVSTNLDMNMEVMWPSALEVNGFDQGNAYISHYINSSWDMTTTSSVTAEGNGMFSLERSGITSLSPFAVFDQRTLTAVGDINEVNFMVYPNPATDKLIIQSTALMTEPLNADIYNATGQLIRRYQITENTSAISVQSLIDGNYFIKFYNGQLNSIKQFNKIN